MNFLPFVFTFLLVLTLISSFLFSSVMGTARENRIILLQHKAYLNLLSDQNKELFEPKEKKKKKKGNSQENANKKKNKTKVPKEPRSENDGCDQRKLNLFRMIHETDPQVKHTLEQTAIRLIEILYGSCDFITSAKTKDIAHTIIQQMTRKEFESFEELTFENEELNQIYYKMLKGTNTGYPAFNEYFNLNENLAPIYFQYATKPVIRAVLGEALAAQVFDLEKQQWQKNKRKKILVKQKFIELAATPQGVVPANIIDEIFTFGNAEKWLFQIRQEKKIRAMHKAEGKIVESPSPKSEGL